MKYDRGLKRFMNILPYIFVFLLNQELLNNNTSSLYNNIKIIFIRHDQYINKTLTVNFILHMYCVCNISLDKIFSMRASFKQIGYANLYLMLQRLVKQCGIPLHSQPMQIILVCKIENK